MPFIGDTRFNLAVVLAPPVPIAIVVVPIFFMRNNPIEGALPIICFFGLIPSYLGLILFGLPLARLLHRFGHLTFMSMCLAGPVSGAITFAGLLLAFSWLLESHNPFNLSGLIWGAAFGLSVAIPFSLISGITSGSSRPDKPSACPSS